MKFLRALVLAWLVGAMTAAGCAHLPAVDHNTAEASTYLVETPGSMCTAWVAAPGYLVTAGHCCHDRGDYTLISTTGRATPASVVEYEDDDNDKPPTDVCLLRAHGRVAAPLVIADRMPDRNEAVGFVGYPLGEYKRSEGIYLGDIDGPFSAWNDYFSNAPCDRGASGSAMFHADGVYGVLVRLSFVGGEIRPGSEGCVASPLSQITDILTAIPAE